MTATFWRIRKGPEGKRAGIKGPNHLSGKYCSIKQGIHRKYFRAGRAEFSKKVFILLKSTFSLFF
jgi:hypothetical protein